MKAKAVLVSVDLVERTVRATFFDGPEARASLARLQDFEEETHPNLLHIAVGTEPFPNAPDEKRGPRRVINAG